MYIMWLQKVKLLWEQSWPHFLRLWGHYYYSLQNCNLQIGCLDSNVTVQWWTNSGVRSWGSLWAYHYTVHSGIFVVSLFLYPCNQSLNSVYSGQSDHLLVFLFHWFGINTTSIACKVQPQCYIRSLWDVNLQDIHVYFLSVDLSHVESWLGFCIAI